MDDKELKQILASKAPAYQRSYIEIPREDIVPHYSSLTDYLDKVVRYETKKLGIIDQLVMRYRLGAVRKLMGGHYGTILGEIFEKQRSDWRTKDFFARIIRQFHVKHLDLTVTDITLEEMLEKSKLERMGHSRRIRLAVYSPTAELAAALANTYVETIKLFTEERNKERCAKALVQIHQQVERAKNLSNEIYQDLLRAENEHRIAVERSNVSAFVLRAAQVPEKPVVPNPWVIFPTGAVLSLGLALVLRNCSCGCGSSRKAPRVTDSRR